MTLTSVRAAHLLGDRKGKNEKGIGQLWGECRSGLVGLCCPRKKKEEGWGERPLCLFDFHLLCLRSRRSTQPSPPLHSLLTGGEGGHCDVTCVFGRVGAGRHLLDLIGNARFHIKKKKERKSRVSANYTLITLARAQKAAVVNVRRRSVASCTSSPFWSLPLINASHQSQSFFCLVTLYLASSSNVNSLIKVPAKWNNWSRYTFYLFIFRILPFCIKAFFFFLDSVAEPRPQPSPILAVCEGAEGAVGWKGRRSGPRLWFSVLTPTDRRGFGERVWWWKSNVVCLQGTGGSTTYSPPPSPTSSLPLSSPTSSPLLDSSCLSSADSLGERSSSCLRLSFLSPSLLCVRQKCFLVRSQ